jgi:23S rRNA pseudouridine1911/1915/1917 synthase
VPANRHTRGQRTPRRARVAPLDILYEDRVLLVINKPAGLLSVPLPKKSAEPSVYDQLEGYLRPQRRRPFVVHRIDRDTSGLVVFAKDPRTQQALKKQFIHREPQRIYLALVYGLPNPREGTWRDHLVWDPKALIQKRTHPRDPRGAEAVCRYSVVEQFRDASLLEVRLETGKRNQIRIQARLRGHTLIGERRYVFGPEQLRPLSFTRQALHAYRLTFRHPVDRRELQFEAPLPDDLSELLGRLRRHPTQ